MAITGFPGGIGRADMESAPTVLGDSVCEFCPSSVTLCVPPSPQWGKARIARFLGSADLTGVYGIRPYGVGGLRVRIGRHVEDVVPYNAYG